MARSREQTVPDLVHCWRRKERIAKETLAASYYHRCCHWYTWMNCFVNPPIFSLVPPFKPYSPPPPLHTHTPNPTPHLHLVKNERSLSQTLLGNRLLQFIQLCCPNYLRRLFIINIIIFTSKRNYFRLRNKGIIKSNNEKGWKERKNLFSCNVKIVI